MEISEKLRSIFAGNLNALLKKTNKSQIDVAKELHIGASTFSSWCTGQKMPRMDKIELLADYFKVNKSDLLENKTVKTYDIASHGVREYNPNTRIPILGDIAAGTPIFAEENIIGYTYTELNGNHTYFALRIRGDSMTAAHIIDGCEVIIRKQDNVDNGEIAAVMINGEGMTLKQFYRHGNMVTLVPKSYNPDHQPQTYDLRITQIDVIGVLEEIKIKARR